VFRVSGAVVPLEGDLIAEVRDAATDQPFGEIGEPPPWPLHEGEPAGRRTLHVEVGEFRVGVEPSDLVVHVRVDHGEPIDSRYGKAAGW
jgi:hypothetical protein